MFAIWSEWTKSFQNNDSSASIISVATTQLEQFGASLSELSETLQQQQNDLSKVVRESFDGLGRNNFSSIFSGQKCEEIENIQNKQDNCKTECTDYFSALPDDILLHIFSQLDVFSLIYRASLVCDRWTSLTNTEHFWKARFCREVTTWQHYQSNHVPKSNFAQIFQTTTEICEKFLASLDNASKEELISTSQTKMTWRHKFLLQYNRNSEEYKHHVSLRVVPVSNEKANLNPKGLNFSPAFSRTFKILIVGEGLETSAKRLVYDMMWGEHTPFKMTRLYPGNEGIGSGVGFEVNGVDLNISAIYNHTKALSRDDDKEKWIDLFRETHALVFVMDLFGDTNNVKEEIDRLLQPWLGLRNNVPILILACCSESGKESIQINDGPHPSPFFISIQLKLEELDRPWCVRQVDVRTLDGIYQGLDWLIPNL